MAFWKVTYSEKYKRAGVWNLGCNFRCLGCSYKLIGYPRPERFPRLHEFKETLSRIEGLERVHFLGGEPTATADLPELLRFCKEELGVITALGHTNGSHLCLDNLDEANVSIKAFDLEKHFKYTGHPGGLVLDNFREAYERGIKLRASTVFTPEIIDIDEVKNISHFISQIDPSVPFRITGYIPVPGAPWRRPTEEEMKEAVDTAKEYLQEVTFSHLRPEDTRHPEKRSDHYIVKRLL